MPLSTHAFTRRSVLAATAGALAPAAAGQEGSAPCWRRAGDLPFPVQEIYPCLHQGRIFLAGGLFGAGGRAAGASARVISYDPLREGVREEARLPTPVHHPQLASVSGELWLLGGFESAGPGVAWTMTGASLRLSPAEGLWLQGPAAPVAHAECVAAVISGRVHLVGGRRPAGSANMSYRDHEDTNAHLVFDPRDGLWSEAAPAPTARNSAASALSDGLFHVIGGRTLAGGPVRDHEIYDPNADRWTKAAPLPDGAGAGGLAASVLSGRIYVFGGEVFEPAPGRVLETVWAYDPRSDAWEAAGGMPLPRHGLGAVRIGPEIWTIGGADHPGGAGTSARMDVMRLAC